MNEMFNIVRGGAKLFLATLREIFDETAYARYLARTQQSPSRGAYVDFFRERQATQARRARCC
jgi:hypothetical protein